MWKYHFCVCTKPIEKIFKKQCEELEKHLPSLVKYDLIIDVDGSKIQRYTLNEAEIVVINSYYLDEVAVDSDIDIKTIMELSSIKSLQSLIKMKLYIFGLIINKNILKYLNNF